MGALAGTAAAVSLSLPRFTSAEQSAIEVWTGASCTCCHDWVAYLRANDFAVTVHDGGNTEARTRLGVPARFASCHVAVAEGYVVEGHVPVREVRRLLAERPDALGIVVPSMPLGSPGMDGPAFQSVKQAYDVLLIAHDGSATVYQSYP